MPAAAEKSCPLLRLSNCFSPLPPNSVAISASCSSENRGGQKGRASLAIVGSFQIAQKRFCLCPAAKLNAVANPSSAVDSASL
eukprot:1221320-Rhodomonas_salina.1